MDGFQAHFIFENESILLHAPFGTLDISDLHDKKVTKISFSQVQGYVHTQVIDPGSGLFWFPYQVHLEKQVSAMNAQVLQERQDNLVEAQKASMERILDPFEICISVRCFYNTCFWPSLTVSIKLWLSRYLPILIPTLIELYERK